MIITSAHGSGGKQTTDLIRDCFAAYFSNDVLNAMEDAAVLTLSGNRIAFTTDSFVVTPLFFPGGDIGRLAVCGTVNDLLVRGAKPQYLTAGFILEEGLDTEVLVRVVRSMSEAAAEAGVQIVAGDTKVVEGKGGMYINTAGIGVVPEGVDIGASKSADGDVILISGTLGDHEACILSSRMQIENAIRSDCAPLGTMVRGLLDGGIAVHAMRDVTRGGLATVLNELASASGTGMELTAGAEPASPQVRAFCGILGLDPYYMGNEGKLVLTVPQRDADKALAIIRASAYGENAQEIGKVYAAERPEVIVRTRSGAGRILDRLIGEGLPRIC